MSDLLLFSLLPNTVQWPSIFVVHFGTCAICVLNGLRDTIFMIKMGLFSEMPVCGSVSEQSSRITAVECDKICAHHGWIGSDGEWHFERVAALIMRDFFAITIDVDRCG